ncbi:signal peptidase [Blastopirellula marina]|uniref:Signal peptidase n=1 Tax=Blastopirellula marina TaxID=124 RepID=A0A2S8FGA1_9BACT|nr:MULTISPECIES: regulatory iron-sulfur-containing complex subunit RicT [Pirellulaceae]PQO31191.1 signal peptidase [Blastopirellula marina]RCS51585.1 signal peptidase [Bremerella cremea]
MAKYIIRYGAMRFLGVFSARAKDEYNRDDQVIIRTKRGLEVGDVLCEATDEAVKQLTDPAFGSIMRAMSEEDVKQTEHMVGDALREEETVRRVIREMNLPMQLVDVEHLFGGERIIVYYLAESRVDFRELVKALASELQTRIEMRQIGVRDEAKLLADYGDCGKPVCCNTHLSEMPPVSMRMAKLQKATLDPTKISGRCGRLKCCLRYEYDTYEELQRDLPPIGSDIVTNSGRGRVLNHEILAGQLLVRMEDNRNIMIDASDVLTVLKRGNGQTGGGSKRGKRRDKKDAADEDGGENTQSNSDNPKE